MEGTSYLVLMYMYVQITMHKIQYVKEEEFIKKIVGSI